MFGAAPLAMAFFLSADQIWAALAGMTLLGVVLLFLTPGFGWQSLLRGGLVPHGKSDRIGAALLIAMTIGAVTGLTLVLVPESFLILPTAAPVLWLMILLLYPILSVLPQEILYRVLFFSRYGTLFGSRRTAIGVNALAFGLAHLFYWNWPAVVLTAIGGAVFAWAYLKKGSFAYACLLHAVAGWALFTTGLGSRYFFHGIAGAMPF